MIFKIIEATAPFSYIVIAGIIGVIFYFSATVKVPTSTRKSGHKRLWRWNAHNYKGEWQDTKKHLGKRKNK